MREIPPVLLYDISSIHCECEHGRHGNFRLWL